MTSDITHVLAQKPNTAHCLTVLRKVLHEQQEWVKVHAAEYLIWAGYPAGVKEIFLEENQKWGTRSPYRIGIWRVLAQTADSDAERKKWTDQIKTAFLDPEGSDRLHASETLAKLRISPMTDDPDVTNSSLNSSMKALVIYTLWSIAFTSEAHLQDARARLIRILSDPSEKESPVKSIAAYATRQIGNVSPSDWKTLADAAKDEPQGSPAKVYLLSSAWVSHQAENEIDREQLALLHEGLLAYKNAKNKGERSEMAMALAEKGTNQDLPVLLSLLRNENPLGNEADDYDVMAAAAYAILRIEAK